jgi:hypothetical protein
MPPPKAGRGIFGFFLAIALGGAGLATFFGGLFFLAAILLLFLSETSLGLGGYFVQIRRGNRLGNLACCRLGTFAAFLHPARGAKEPLLGSSDLFTLDCSFRLSGHKLFLLGSWLEHVFVEARLLTGQAGLLRQLGNLAGFITWLAADPFG